MPKKQIIGVILQIVVLSLLCVYIYDNFKVEKKTTLVVEKGQNYNTIVHYLDNKKADYYTYNIDNIVVDFPDRDLDLNRALDLNQITMKEVLEFLTEKVELNEGKVKLYQNEDFSLLECKFDNKTNYIFGDTTMVYKESFCAPEPYLCSYTKTYTVIDINNGKDNKSTYVTLKNDLSEEVSTMELANNLTSNLEINKGYKFTFASTNNKVDVDIKSVFANNELISITPLEENEQPVNDGICK